jgi:hypothetical protein
VIGTYKLKWREQQHASQRTFARSAAWCESGLRHRVRGREPSQPPSTPYGAIIILSVSIICEVDPLARTKLKDARHLIRGSMNQMHFKPYVSTHLPRIYLIAYYYLLSGYFASDIIGSAKICWNRSVVGLSKILRRSIL